jgi:hypothetical protein
LDNSGNTQGLLITETGGTWAAGVEAALPANAAASNGREAEISSVSCASPGNCSAVGTYSDSSGTTQGLLLDSPAPAVTLTVSKNGTCALAVDADTRVTAKFMLIPCIVPKVKGKTLPAARKALNHHDCTVGKIRHAGSRTIKKGRVISQKPKPGVRLKHEGKVKLVISKSKRH